MTRAACNWVEVQLRLDREGPPMSIPQTSPAAAQAAVFLTQLKAQSLHTIDQPAFMTPVAQ